MSMGAVFKEQFEELKHTGELPSPSGVGMRIVVETQREDCSLDRIAAVIQADPALTGLHLGSQAAIFGDVAANAAGIRTSNALDLRIGIQ